MKKAKRIISIFLVLVIASGLLAGCKKEEAVDSGKRTLTVGIPQSSVTPDYDTNKFCTYLEEKTGIDIKWKYYANAPQNYKQQITLACSANDELPDVFLGFQGFDHYFLNQLGEDGYCIDLRDLLEDHAPNFQKAMKQLDKDYQEYLWEKGTNTNTGAFYAMPMAMELYMDNLQSMTWINKTWLDKVGKSIPTTVDELYDVLKAWKAYGDLNGNGKQDEMYMLADAATRYYVVNAFVEMQGTNWNVKDGKLWDPVVSDEYRQALIFFNNLVKEGLVDKMAFTLSEQEYKQVITPTSGGSTVGIWSGHYSGRTNHAMNQLDEFVALPALADYTGKGGYTIYTDHVVYWTTVISKDCENPELAMELIDCFYEDETVSRMRHGEKDVDWTYEEGTNVHGTKSYVKVINEEAFSDRSLNITVGNWLGIMTHWNYSALEEDDSVLSNYGKNSNRLYKEQWKYMLEGKRPEEPLGDLVYTTEEYDKREEKAGTSNEHITSTAVLFISGEKDPSDDAVWNTYLQEVKQLGREELQKIAQAAYDRKTK